MATFVHLTPESQVARLRRNGISRLRSAADKRAQGVFAVPVTPSFHISHQWLRELRRRGQGAFAAVYFRVPDDLPVWVGHYGQAHREMSAAEAVETFLSAGGKEGWQVVIPRRIEASEIFRTKRLRQLVGWRFSPTAKGRRPCPCPFCSCGEFGAKSIRARLGEPPGEA